jgi:uncharacterized protein YuzE
MMIPKNLTIRYDKIGDILYLDRCPPYADQESEEIGDEILVRLNPTTGTIENLAILFFSKRLQTTNIFELPVIAELQLAS